MFDDDDIVYIGERDIWGGRESFGLHRKDRRQHLYCLGKTGTGKTTLLRNLILQDILAGEGVGVIDPHGDLSEELLDHIPPHRIDDVVYFNPVDLDFPIGFNLLRTTPQSIRHLAASGLVSAFKSIWHESWGPRLEYILYAAASALLECENASILGIQRMLSDDRYRAWVLRQVKDPMVRSFWINEFEQYQDRFMMEAVAPIQNKVGQLMMSPIVRNIFGQVRSKVDPSFMMNNRRILIANLAKGKLGADKANLIGAMLVTQFQLAAMSRAFMAEDERKDFFLYVDELQNFSTDTFASLLSESRKYRLCLTLSHQYTSQLDPRVRDSVFGNVGTLVAFRVGKDDAYLLSREFSDQISPKQFTELGNHEIAVKLLNRGTYPDAFAAKTFAPSGRRFNRTKTIIERSRQKYGTLRKTVEHRIDRWMKNN